MRIILVIFALTGFMIGTQSLIKYMGATEGGGLTETLHPVNREAPAPSSEITVIGGGSTTLAEWDGQVRIVALWATWCGVCAREMPQLQALAERFEGRGLVVLPVSIDTGPAEGLVTTFLKSRGMDSLPGLIDKDQAMARQIELRGTPTTMIIDKFGQIVAAFEGLGPWEDEAADEYLKNLIAAPDSATGRALLGS